AVLRACKNVVGWQALQCVTDDLPVHEISGMENGKTGNAVEARGGEVKIVADANHVRIGIVSLDDRITVSAIAIVSRKNVLSHKEAQQTQKDFLNQFVPFVPYCDSIFF